MVGLETSSRVGLPAPSNRACPGNNRSQNSPGVLAFLSAPVSQLRFEEVYCTCPMRGSRTPESLLHAKLSGSACEYKATNTTAHANTQKHVCVCQTQKICCPVDLPEENIISRSRRGPTITLHNRAASWSQNRGGGSSCFFRSVLT